MSDNKPDKDINDKARKVSTAKLREITERLQKKAPRPHIVYLEGKKEDKHRLPMPDNGSELIKDDTVKIPPEAIGGLCHERERIVISAAAKAAKTFLAMDAATKLATGRDWIGHKITRRHRVLVLNMEIERAWFRNRLVKIEEKNEYAIPKDNMIIFHFREATVNLSELIDDLSTQFSPGMFDWVIIDPIYALFGELRETDSGDMQEFCKEMKRLSANLQAGLICVHHFPKGSAAGKSSIDRMGGSAVLGRFFDVVLSLTKHEEEDCQVLEYDNRNGIKSNPKGLRFKYPTYELDESIDVTKLDSGRKVSASRTPDMSKYDAQLIISSFPREWIKKKDIPFFMKKNFSVSKIDSAAMVEKFCLETQVKNGKTINELNFEDGEQILERFCVQWRSGSIQFRAR